MRFLIVLMIVIFILPLIASLFYYIILSQKRYRAIDFKKCGLYNEDEENEIIKILNSTSKTVTNNVNAWLYLVWFFHSLVFILDVWCASYSLMSLFVLYNVKDNSLLSSLISTCAIVSLISSILSLCLKPNDKYITVIDSWHKASEITGKYQLKICELLIKDDKNIEQIRIITDEYQNDINEISNNTVV